VKITTSALLLLLSDSDVLISYQDFPMLKIVTVWRSCTSCWMLKG